MLPPAIKDWPLDYGERLQQREPAAVTLVVIHCTELPDLARARAYGERICHPSGTGNSGHFYIDRDGSTWRFVEVTRIAHHVRGQNAHSLGIELVNIGRWPAWLDSRNQIMTEPYTEPQLESLLTLIAHLRTRLPNLAWLAGHEDLDRDRVPASDDARQTVRRKRDPGPAFPWQRVVHASGLTRLPRHGVDLTGD